MNNNITDFLELSFEKRHNDKVNRLKYNKASNDNISKEYYSKTERDKQNKKTEVGKSLNQGNWDINIYDNDKVSSKSAKHSEIEVGQMFSDFGIDAKPFISSKSSKTKEKKETKSKKASTKKSSKKKSKKKEGAKKKSNRKKSM